MSDQSIVFEPVLIKPAFEYTVAERAAIISQTLIVLGQDENESASTGYVANILNKLDPELAKSTGEITLKAIAESPGLSSQLEHKLRVNFLINAFERLNMEVKVEHSR
jgi:benzoyl-CoA reductase/2-hydroxyglutaryl-CoA dehydratase subunit BcrC/BadD/HgdB